MNQNDKNELKFVVIVEFLPNYEGINNLFYQLALELTIYKTRFQPNHTQMLVGYKMIKPLNKVIKICSIFLNC